MQRLPLVPVCLLFLLPLAGCDIGGEHSSIYGRGVTAMEDIGSAAQELRSGGSTTAFASRVQSNATQIHSAAKELQGLPSATSAQANRVRRQYTSRIKAAGKKLESISPQMSPGSPQEALQIMDPMLSMMEGLIALDEALGFPNENEMRSARSTVAQLQSMRNQIAGMNPGGGSMPGMSSGMNGMASQGMMSSSMPGMYPGMSPTMSSPGYNAGIPSNSFSSPSISSYAGASAPNYSSPSMPSGSYGLTPPSSMGLTPGGFSAPTATYGMPQAGSTGMPASGFAGGGGLGSSRPQSNFSSPPHEKVIAEIIAARQDIVLSLEFATTKANAMNARESIRKSVERMKGIAKKVEKLKPLSEGDWQELNLKHGDKLEKLDQQYDFALTRATVSVPGGASIFKNTTAEIKQASEILRKAFVSVTKSQSDDMPEEAAGDAPPTVGGFDTGEDEPAEKPTRKPAEAPALKAVKPKQSADSSSEEKPTPKSSKPSKPAQSDEDPDFSGFGGS